MIAARSEWEARWKEMGGQFALRRGRFYAGEKGKTDEVRRNSRPRIIADEFAAGLKSGMTSSVRPWFALAVSDPELLEHEAVKAWLSDSTQKTLTVIGRTNFDEQAFAVYKEEGVFGTGCLFVDEDDEEVFTCRALTIGSYAIGQDWRGRVNRLARDMIYTGEELAEEFGEEKLPEEILVMKRGGDNAFYSAPFEVRQLIEPNPDYAPDTPGSAGMKWRSVKWLAGRDSTKHLLSVGGYHEFPAMVPRWRTVGNDLYGSEHPGEIALDDAKTIQDIETDERRALKLKVDPPLLIPKSLERCDLDLRPGGATYYPELSEMSANSAPVVIPVFAAAFDHMSAADKIARLTAGIEKAFFVDLFRMWGTDFRQGRTATEIEAREQEKMYALEPAINRQMYDFLDPFVIRVFGICSRRGLYGEMPEQLAGRPFKIEYTSALAKSQKQASQHGLETVMGVAGELAKLQITAGERPAVLDKLDVDEVLEIYADMHCIPSGVVLGDDVVGEMREAKEEEKRRQEAMQAEAQAAQMAPGLAGAAKDLSQTRMDGGGPMSAMDMLMGGM